MRKFLSRLTAAALSASLAVQALAAPPLAGSILGKQAFHGPGSRGFRPTCSGVFDVLNFLEQSNNFGTAPWSAVGSATAPTVTSGATDPNGGTTAYSLTFPVVSAAAAYSEVFQTLANNLNDFPYAFGVWVKVTSAAGNGTANIAMVTNSPSIFDSTPVPNDGQWHLVMAASKAMQFVNAPYVMIGVNLTAGSGQAATTGPVTVSVWNGYVTNYPLANYITAADVSGPLATTTAIATATMTIPCPKGVAFRNFDEQAVSPKSPYLAPAINNPIIPQSHTSIYASAGASNPYVNAMYYAGYYWGFTNTGTTLSSTLLVSFTLQKSRDGLNWTEDTLNAPYLQSFGSVLESITAPTPGTGYGVSVSGTITFNGGSCYSPPVINVTTNSSGGIASATYVSGVCPFGTWPAAQSAWGGTVAFSGGISSGTGAVFAFGSLAGTGSAAQWQIHPAWLPYGCNVSGTPHQFCVLYSARDTSNAINSAKIYLGYSDTIDGVYTPVGCTPPGVCATPTSVIPTFPNTPTSVGSNSLVTVVNVGGINGTNYLYSSNVAENGLTTNVWKTAANPATAGAGTTITWQGIALPTKVTGVDWDFGTAYQDNNVTLNKCGFYEYFYTIEGTSVVGTSKGQVIGYAVSNSPFGPWWKYPAVVHNVGSSLFGGAAGVIGDTAVTSINGRFLWLGNFYNPSNQTSAAMAAVMPDACVY